MLAEAVLWMALQTRTLIYIVCCWEGGDRQAETGNTDSGQAKRQTDRLIDRHTSIQTNRKTENERVRERDREREREREKGAQANTPTTPINNFPTRPQAL